MGINTLFNIGESAVTAQRLAIEVTSQNIANVNTAGYSRQRAIMETGPTVVSAGISIGSGVRLADVQRSYDSLLQTQITNGNSTAGKDSALLSSLQQVEPYFNELTNNGLGQAMEDFFNSWHDLSVNPQGTPEREAVLARSQVLVNTFHQLSTSLGSVLSSADTTLSGISDEITDQARNIANLNLQIRTTLQLGGSANELRDQRDYLIQQLSSNVGVTVSPEDSEGMVTVSLPSAVGAPPANALVSGIDYRRVYAYDNGTDNDLYLTALGNPPPDAVAPPAGAIGTLVTDTIGGTGNSLGKIGGTLQIRDSIVGGTGDTYLARLDEMANQLVSVVNTQHADGFGLDGLDGRNFFNPANVTSGTISLDASLTTAKIAAGGTAVGTGDNTNALLLAGLKSTDATFTVDGTPLDTTFGGYYNTFVSKVGIDVQSATNATKQNDGFLRQLNSLRESNSGVSLDEELTNLIKYQRAFEAAAKTINAATDMMDIVLGMVR